MTTSTTLRLPDGLKTEADAYACRLGISLNALCAVALRDYLDARSQSEVVPVPVVRENLNHTVVHQKPRKPGVPAPVVYVVPDRGVYEPCPCGSGKKWKFCHGEV